MFNNLEKKINCGGRTISEYDEDLSQNLSVEEILINSGNIGSVKIGQKLGVDKIKNFLTRIGILVILNLIFQRLENLYLLIGENVNY